MNLIPDRNYKIVNADIREKIQIKSGVWFAKKDLLISKITPCFENGKQGIVELNDGGITSTEIITVKSIDKFSNNLFLHYYLIQPKIRSYLTSRMQGSTGRKRLPLHELKSLKISLPSYQEQLLISQDLVLLDDRISLLEKKKDVIKSIFDRSLNDLMLQKISVDHITFTHQK